MIDKNNILKFVQHVYRRGSGIPDRRMFHPRREWLIGLMVFLVIIVVAAIWSVHSFNVYKTIDSRTYEVQKEVPTYNANQVNFVLNQFAEREGAFNVILNEIKLFTEVHVSDTASTTDVVLESATSTKEMIGTENVIVDELGTAAQETVDEGSMEIIVE